VAETAADVAGAVFGPAEAVADAVMYEGYLLYPYRRSSAKNQVRWQFGVLTPRSWAEARGTPRDGVAGSAESWWQQSECLIQAPGDARLAVRVRFLQLQRRQVSERTPEGAFRLVPDLRAGPRRELTFDEAVPRSFDLNVNVGALLPGGRDFPLAVPGSVACETVTDGQGDVVGQVTRSRRPIAALVQVSGVGLPGTQDLVRLRVRIANAVSSTDPAVHRDGVLAYSLISTHSMLAVDKGSLLSLLEPPAWAEEASRACTNVRTFPVLAGATTGTTGCGTLMLSAPIILGDYPRIAPESPGDLHDATEIDEILTLRALTLTDSEKSEARATDARAAAILDRVETMPPAVLGRLHGTIRSGDQADGDGHTPRAPAGTSAPPHEHDDAGTPWWDPGADTSVSPATDSVTIAGTRVARGSRVRLWPRKHGTDPQDMFLGGKVAAVEAVLSDVDGSSHLAVILEDDPGADLHRWYGRFRYFAPEEVEPLPDTEMAPQPADGGRP
jgi:hypothetical protein